MQRKKRKLVLQKIFYTPPSVDDDLIVQRVQQWRMTCKDESELDSALLMLTPVILLLVHHMICVLLHGS